MIKLKYSNDCGLWLDLLDLAGRSNTSVGEGCIHDALSMALHVQAFLRTHEPVTHQKAELLHSFQYELLVSDLIDSQILQVLGRQLEQIHAR